MKHIVMHGSFHVKGRAPDGDSVAFRAKNAAHWDHFKWRKPSSKPDPVKNRPVQLRIEAVDALETHYEGFNQPKAIAQAATDTLLRTFGITALSYNLNFTKIVDATDGVPGTLISAGLDGFDRPISFVAKGHVLKDGDMLERMPEDLLVQTVNYELAVGGVVYPAYYFGIDGNALKVFQEVFEKTRAGRIGIWAFDRTSEFTYWGPQTVIDSVIVYPKVFRRLVCFAEARAAFDDIGAYLKSKPDYLTVLSRDEDTQLDRLVQVSGRKVAIDLDPNNVLFGKKKKASEISG